MSKKMGVQTAYTEEYIQLYLLHEKHTKNRSLRDLAKEFKVSHGAIQRALKGVLPKRKDLREKMGLVPIEEVEVCLRCGVVHTTKRCTSTNGSKPRPPRIAIRLDKPDSAATTILEHMDQEKVSELIDLLKEG